MWLQVCLYFIAVMLFQACNLTISYFIGLYKHLWRLLLTLNQHILNVCVSYLSIIAVLSLQNCLFSDKCNWSHTSCLGDLPSLHCRMLTSRQCMIHLSAEKVFLPFPELISQCCNYRSQFTCRRKAGGRFYPWVSPSFTKDQRRRFHEEHAAPEA